ncbi:lithostathine-1-alpha-like [Nerophis lumbriciformis]|uniref:lithostathine-1-alpha-like n=1 Tax=Nerophis lumbriciformis TaxID=546530 RepID=UPI002ADF3566|nr:ladderlectin-like [Nerophis lumbriciformis]
MAFSLRVLFLLCGIGGALTAVVPAPKKEVCCPTGWTQKDEHCYIYKAEKRTFSDAERICNLIGGNLGSIRTPVENAVVFQLVKKGGGDEAWIGLHDALKSENYLWTDGTPFVYENFATGAASGSDKCVVIETANDGQWKGEPCGDDEPYVCIREALCK